MGKWLFFLIVLFAAALGALYYYLYMPKERDLAECRQTLSAKDQELGASRARVAALEDGSKELKQTNEGLQKRVEQTESELTALRSTQDGLLDELKQEIASKQIEVERIRDQLRVDMVDEILFGSGEAALKPEGLALLKRIGAVLKKDQNREIEVQGHTDNLPIKRSLAKTFPTNWELSAARATNVVRYLEEEAKLNPARLSAKSFSMNRPKASNKNEASRRKNRRIEILLSPLSPPLFAGDKQGATPAAMAQPTAPDKTAAPDKAGP